MLIFVDFWYPRGVKIVVFVWKVFAKNMKSRFFLWVVISVYLLMILSGFRGHLGVNSCEKTVIKSIETNT